MEKATRSRDQNATSILWAHQIRRENVEIVHQLDDTRAELASTTSTVNDLKQRIEELSHQVEIRPCHVDEILQGIEGRFNESLQTVLDRIKALETENNLLKRKLEFLERRSASPATTLRSRVDAPVQTIVFDSANGSLGLDNGPESEILVPDSMPMDKAQAQQQYHFVRSLSETTWGSPSLSGEQESQSQTNRIPERNIEPDESVGQLMKQNGRTLVDYLSHAERIQSRMLQSGVGQKTPMVEAFVQGVDGPSTRTMLEERLRFAGYSWQALTGVIHDIVEKSEVRMVEKSGPVEGNGSIGSTTGRTPAENQSKCRPKRKRRFIPIVPADEEELLEIRASRQVWPGTEVHVG
ncbi:hypothetical protein EYZ11_012153 [Aspergillus tanneri]|uniref:Uncharacterized protein n=1 Tax=Aspergillus tanneri TaxID=1220188 RepID=A0A4S3J0Z8_9EURO|nr:hypothetical protein EYZ11_012153 [Aspergillus tanneri]